MVRLFAVLVSLVVTLGCLLAPHSAKVARKSDAPDFTRPVDQGIPLTHIDLRAEVQPLTAEEVATGIRWWQDQSQTRLDQLTDLLRNESGSNGWTTLYASAAADGHQVVVVLGNQGRLGTIRFAADGALLLCDPTPDEVLPIILPSAAGGFRRLTASAVRGIEVRLRYLRERSPVAWAGEAEQRVIGECVLEFSEVVGPREAQGGIVEPEVILIQGCSSSEPPQPVTNN